MKRFSLALLLLPLLFVQPATAQFTNYDTMPTPESYSLTAAASFSGKQCGSANITAKTLTANRRQVTLYNGTDQPIVVVLNGVQAIYLFAGMLRVMDFYANNYFFIGGGTIQLCYPGSAPATGSLLVDGVF